MPRLILAAGLTLLLAWALWLLWLWQPERQVLKHQAHFLRAIEKRNWPRAGEFISPQYGDRWGYDKATVLQEASQVLRQFFVLSIEQRLDRCTVAGESGEIVARIRLAGQGTALAEMAKSEVNSLETPFAFRWIRQSAKPWDWQLTRVENEQLKVHPGAVW